MKNKNVWKKIAEDSMINDKDISGLLLKLIRGKRLSYDFNGNYCFFACNKDNKTWEMHGDEDMNLFLENKDLYFTSLDDIKEYRNWEIHYSNIAQSPEERKRFGKDKPADYKIIKLEEIK